MPDREKVIKGLKCHQIDNNHRINCADCPYYVDDDNHIRCVNDLHDNAIALLKEQEATWVEYPECLKYENAYSTDHIVCSACQHVFSTIDNCTEEFMHCPHCGAKMI